MSKPDITTSITLTLLFRSVGAVIFGVLADRFGRKWTLVVNLILIAVFELATGFVNTFSAFLAVRALFGIAMGGIWLVVTLSRRFCLRKNVRADLTGVKRRLQGSRTFPSKREDCYQAFCSKVRLSRAPASFGTCGEKPR